ncbi:hypothetical protein [Nocardia xishanensis]|uniref:hypothetical protein n=1 Tax=Nocardia xishanensis TaxID=238964 RepID=UPI001FE074D6|nr:hypothetical protein [Nocardia xishanensis]
MPPIRAARRDILRGFALFGILIIDVTVATVLWRATFRGAQLPAAHLGGAGNDQPRTVLDRHGCGQAGLVRGTARHSTGGRHACWSSGWGSGCSAVTFANAVGLVHAPWWWMGVQELVNLAMTFAYIAGVSSCSPARRVPREPSAGWRPRAGWLPRTTSASRSC